MGDRHGFTLLEVVVVIVLLAILSAIVFPIVHQFVAKAEATAFVLGLEADIGFVQKKSVAEERGMRLIVSHATTHPYYYILEQRGVMFVTTKTVRFPEGVTANNDLHLTFNPVHNFKGHAVGNTLGIKFNGRPFADIVITPISVRTRVEWK